MKNVPIKVIVINLLNIFSFQTCLQFGILGNFNRLHEMHLNVNHRWQFSPDTQSV